MNLVPSARTRDLAEVLVQTSSRTTGLDAVLDHLDHLEALDQAQRYALVGVLLTQVKAHGRPGRPPKKLVFTAKQRREAHRRFRNGDTSAETLAAEREYQAVNQRQRRERRRREAS